MSQGTGYWKFDSASLAFRSLISNVLPHYPIFFSSINTVLMLDSQSCNNMHQVCVMGKDQFTERCISYPDIMILTFLPAKIIISLIEFYLSSFLFFVKETFSVKTFNLYLPRQSHMVYSFRFLLPLLLLPTTHSKCTSFIETQRLISGFCWQVGQWYVTFIMWYFPFDQLTTQFFTILQSSSLITYLSPNLISISAFNCKILHLPLIISWDWLFKSLKS